MGLRLNGSTSGYVELNAPAVAGTTNLTVPLTGFGKVLQVIGATDATSQSATASYVSTPLAATITPSSSNSRIFVIANVNLDISQTATAATIANMIGSIYYSIAGGSTGYLPVFAHKAYDTRSRGTMFGQENTGMQTIINLHSPSTTSAITYTFQIRYVSAGSSNVFNYNNWSTVSAIYLIEVGP